MTDNLVTILFCCHIFIRLAFIIAFASWSLPVCSCIKHLEKKYLTIHYKEYPLISPGPTAFTALTVI